MHQLFVDTHPLEIACDGQRVCGGRHTDRGLPAGESGAVTVIQRANSDLRCNPHFHMYEVQGPASAPATRLQLTGR